MVKAYFRYEWIGQWARENVRQGNEEAPRYSHEEIEAMSDLLEARCTEYFKKYRTLRNRKKEDCDAQEYELAIKEGTSLAQKISIEMIVNDCEKRHRKYSGIIGDILRFRNISAEQSKNILDTITPYMNSTIKIIASVEDVATCVQAIEWEKNFCTHILNPLFNAQHTPIKPCLNDVLVGEKGIIPALSIAPGIIDYHFKNFSGFSEWVIQNYKKEGIEKVRFNIGEKTEDYFMLFPFAKGKKVNELTAEEGKKALDQGLVLADQAIISLVEDDCEQRYPKYTALISNLLQSKYLSEETDRKKRVYLTLESFDSSSNLINSYEDMCKCRNAILGEYKFCEELLLPIFSRLEEPWSSCLVKALKDSLSNILDELKEAANLTIWYLGAKQKF